MSTNFIFSKYNYLNYFFISLFIILNIALDREYRNIIAIIFILVMLTLLTFKIIYDLKNSEDNNLKYIQNTVLKILLVTGILVIFYYIL